MDTSNLLNHILTFLLTLYSQETLNRKIVLFIIRYFSKFLIKIFLPTLKIEILKCVKIDKPKKEIDLCFQKICKIFSQVDTEDKIFYLLKEKGYGEPKFDKVGIKFVDKIINNEHHSVPEDILQVYVPLRHSLQIFLQIPTMFEKIELYINYLKFDSIHSNIIINIMQAKLWQRKYANGTIDGLLLPLYLYYDDFEGGNALGSHAGTNKFGALYASLGCLPPEISSKFSSIIFSSLIYAKDAKLCNLRS